MCPARPLIIRLSISALLLLAVVPGVRAASVFDPAYRFRTLSTEHFIVYFHQGEDRLAARLAAIAEDTWQKLRVPLGRTPPALTHVVLVDQTELANGSATPLPYDTIVVTAVWPGRMGVHRQHRRLAAAGLHARVHAHRPSRSV